MTLLTDDERARLASELAEWRVEGGALVRTFRFKDFSAAWGFMCRAALAAEKADHHPDWTNVYNRVEVRLTTHDAGGLTGKDAALARAMDEAAGA